MQSDCRTIDSVRFNGVCSFLHHRLVDSVFQSLIDSHNGLPSTLRREWAKSGVGPTLPFSQIQILKFELSAFSSIPACLTVPSAATNSPALVRPPYSLDSWPRFECHSPSPKPLLGSLLSFRVQLHGHGDLDQFRGRSNCLFEDCNECV